MLAQWGPMTSNEGAEGRFHQTTLTTHSSNDAASAPELETSRLMPRRFLRISCSFSKFVRGGGKCRLQAT